MQARTAWPAAVSDKNIEWADQFGAALGSDLG